MATAAFRSNTKRTPIPASSSSSTRRSRSLSRHPAPDAAPLKGRFVNTERGSGYSDAELDGMTEFFMAIGDDEAADEARRGRTAERRVSTIAERRGRSVVRKGVSDGGKAASEGGSARRRSVSVARHRQPNSESYSSAVTDDETPDSHSNNGNVKTIRAVYAQKKSDHPVREVDENGLLQAMRKEVQHAVEEIRTELEQVMVRSMPVPSSKDNLPSDGAEIVRAIGEIRRSYTEKLEQSEKRKRDLLAELAVEEQRGLEISRIVRELLPDSAQTTKCLKQSQFRKRSNDRTRMSRRLTEEAEKYFVDFLSNVEDTDYSSIDGERSDASSSLVGGIMTKEAVNGNGKGNVSECSEKGVSLPAEMDGVALPWLQWETTTPPPIKENNFSSVQDVSLASSSFASSSPNCNSSCSIISAAKRCPDAECNSKQVLAGLSSFDMEEYRKLHTEETLLFEIFKQRPRMESGGLLLCCRTYL